MAIEKAKWGIVGLGRIVNGTMAPAMAQDTNSEIVAGVSRSQEKADEFAETFDARLAFTKYEEMLEDPAINSVFIATPNAFHESQAVAAAQAGKNVLCDKPMALDAQGALRVVKACADNGVALGVNFHNRRLAWVEDTKKLLSEGAIGEVLMVQMEVSAGHRPPSDWRSDPALAGLGTTFNQGVHAFDALRYILGSDPVAVTSSFDEENLYEVETQSLHLMRFGNGTRAYVNVNQNIPYPMNDVQFFGTSGRVSGRELTRSRQDGVLSVLTESGTDERNYPQPSGQAHADNLMAFTRSLVTGVEPNASGLDGLHSAILCDAIRESVLENRTATLDYTPLSGTTPKQTASSDR